VEKPNIVVQPGEQSMAQAKKQPLNKRPNRQSMRKAGYDYTAPGVYFVTICTHERQHLVHPLKPTTLAIG
jgi:hypothetical protein